LITIVCQWTQRGAGLVAAGEFVADSADAFIATARKQPPPTISINKNFITSLAQDLTGKWGVDIQNESCRP